MEIIKTKVSLIEKISSIKKNSHEIGFVPTMGALHNGHLSLIEFSKKNTDVTVASIFVNPTQFNNPDDLKKYPRTLEADIEKLESRKTDILFLPNQKEMYPDKDIRNFDFGNLDEVMEGKYRKGHFNGVAQIVSKLFDCVSPDYAYFGLKDLQQYVIIKELVRKYMPLKNIKIIGCPIIREDNGLAMSSRNELLSVQQRQNAGKIYEVLNTAKKQTKRFSVDELKKIVVRQINENNFLKVEYFEIVDDEKLDNIVYWNENSTKVGCIAVFCGSVRLIDNIYFS